MAGLNLLFASDLDDHSHSDFEGFNHFRCDFGRLEISKNSDRGSTWSTMKVILTFLTMAGNTLFSKIFWKNLHHPIAYSVLYSLNIDMN
jgi:hypothetical protein